MSILISGSVAFDTIVSTTWTFKSQILPDALDSFNLSLFAPEIRREYGWTAGNIAYNLALLGKNPDIVASVWQDADPYVKRLESLWIGTELIKTFPDSFSAHGFIIGDEIGRQITAFHPGAMSFSWEIQTSKQTYSHAIVSPDSKNGMIRRIRECVAAWTFTIFDPGQAMGLFDASELTDMVVSADMTIMNEYEANWFLQITGEAFDSKTNAFGKIGIVTLGENWSNIYEDGKTKHVPATFTESVLDATGCWDAYRWWLLFWLSEGWNIEKSCRLWSILGGIKIRHFWWQNHAFDKNAINEIANREFWETFFS